MKIEHHVDKVNTAKQHLFITVDDGSVWYNQAICGQVFYQKWSLACDTGYVSYYSGDGVLAKRGRRRSAPKEIEMGSCFLKFINQADRECQVAEINRTRTRVEYELPRAGLVNHWMPIAKFNGKTFVSRS